MKPPAPPERARTATAGTFSQKRSSAEELEREREELARGEERVQNFEEAFNRIKAATGIEEIDELVRLFVKNEDQNFSLFNYVTEQTNEIEKLQEAISQLQEEEAKYASQGGADVEKHELIVADLEKRVRETEIIRGEVRVEVRGISEDRGPAEEGHRVDVHEDGMSSDGGLCRFSGHGEQHVDYLGSYRRTSECDYLGLRRGEA